MTLQLTKLESSSPVNVLCQIWLKLAQWFWRRFLNYVNVFSLSCYYLSLENDMILHFSFTLRILFAIVLMHRRKPIVSFVYYSFDNPDSRQSLRQCWVMVEVVGNTSLLACWHWPNTKDWSSVVGPTSVLQPRTNSEFWVVGSIMAQHILADCNRIIFLYIRVV